MRYADSPRVEVMPQIPDSNDFGKTAANKRLQPKSSEVKENFEYIAEQLGGEIISIDEGGKLPNFRYAVDDLGKLIKVAKTEVPRVSTIFAEPKKSLDIIMKPLPEPLPTLSPKPKPKQALDLAPPPQTTTAISVKPKQDIRRTTSKPKTKPKQTLDLSLPKTDTKSKPTTSTLTKTQTKPAKPAPKVAVNLADPNAIVKSPIGRIVPQNIIKVKVSDITKPKLDQPLEIGKKEQKNNKNREREIPNLQLPRGGEGRFYYAQSL